MKVVVCDNKNKKEKKKEKRYICAKKGIIYNSERKEDRQIERIR